MYSAFVRKKVRRKSAKKELIKYLSLFCKMFDVIFLLTKNTEKRLIGIEGAAGPKMRTLRYKGKIAESYYT